MAAMLEDSFRRVLARFDELGDTLASGVEGEKFVSLSKEYAELEPVVTVIRALDAARREFADLQALMTDEGTDSEMRALVEEDF
jgi:peptide chain release factor 1